MEERVLMKIRKATFGFGGYDESMFGLQFDFESPGSGVSNFVGFWPLSDNPHQYARWTKQDQFKSALKAQLLLEKTLRDAKKRHVAELAGTPVEVTLDGNCFKSFRVLVEVL